MGSKLIVTIPAYNEEKSIGEVIKSIPRTIKGIDKVEVLVLDDGSTDNTAQAAKNAGADFVFKHKVNLHLAKTFRDAVVKALGLGADIVVNTDADNQYDQGEIPKLIQPILDGKADMVNGNRQIDKLTHMPKSKKIGNTLGSWTIRLLTGVKIKDASSGFRAYTKEAVEAFNFLSRHTYTHETIIDASFNDIIIAEVPITFKRRSFGQSKLISGVWSHIKSSGATILRTILMYKAFKMLVSLGALIVVLGAIGAVRFLAFYYLGQGDGHIQSLIFSSILISLGFNAIMLGVIADLISINRKLIKRQ